MAAQSGPFKRLIDQVSGWPVLRQVANLGMGPEATSEHTRHWQARVLDAARSQDEVLGRHREPRSGQAAHR